MATIPHLAQERSFRMPAEFWLRRAQRCREQNQPLRAVTLLRHAVQLEPDSPALKIEYALQLHDLGCYESSNRECFDALSRHPAAFAVFGLLALNWAALGDMGQAMDAYAFYSRFAQLHPEELPEWDEEVYDVEDELAALPQRRRQPVRLQTLLRSAGRRLARGEIEKAGALLSRAKQKPFPARFPSREALEALWRHLSGQPLRAVSLARKAISGPSRSAALLQPMALLLFRLGQKAAYPALLRAALYARDADEEYGVCVAAREMQCAWVARAMLERTLRYTPNRMSAVYDLSVLFLGQGQLGEASALIHRLREIDPEDQAVESLFRVISNLESGQGGEKEIREAGANQCFYGEELPFLTQSLARCLPEMKEGIQPFARRLTTDSRLYRQFLDVLALDEDFFTLLPGVCQALPGEEAAALLRRALLLPGLTRNGIGEACRLLGALGKPPPYLIRTGGRIALMDPAAPPPPSPSFVQRRLWRQLKKTKTLCGNAQVIPFTLGLLPRLSRAARNRMLGDFDRVWPLAIRAAFYRQMGLPSPVLRLEPFSPSRLRAFLQAVGDLHQAQTRRQKSWN